MKYIPGMLKNSQGVVMVVAICILLAVTALGIGMVTNAAMSSTIAKNYMNKIQSFNASDGVMTTLAQAVIDSTESNWTGGGGGGSNDTLWAISSATASGVCACNTGATAAMAVDKNTGTRWESKQTGNCTDPTCTNPCPDPSWIYVDLGSPQSISSVVIMWQNANAKNYTLEGSNDHASWTNLATKTNMPTGARTDSVYGLSSTYQYVRMNGTARNTIYGYSIYEFRVHGPKAATTLAMDTIPMGDYKVVWSINTGTGCSNCYNIQTTALKQNSTWGVVFKTPLNQYVERAGGLAAVAPDSINVPVVYRDFHQDRTCPEFEQKFWSGAYGVCGGSTYCGAGAVCGNPAACPTPSDSLWKSNEFKNMVMRHLDADHKPLPNPRHYHGNVYIKYWFRDWAGPGGPHTLGDSTQPVYYRPANHDTTTMSWHECNHPTGHVVDELWGADSVFFIKHNNHDTAYKNFTIYDTLPFKWNAARQTYSIHNNSFFPLDGRGFATAPTDQWNTGDSCGGSAGNGHNFGYTMEIQTTMIKKPNQWFAFSGDDDLWVFINDTLVFDGGGRTHGGGDSVNTNNMAFLTDGATYRFSVFYCERHSTGQVCNLETNMIQYTSTSSKQRAWRRDYGPLD